jgi:hypothetical protein
MDDNLLNGLDIFFYIVDKYFRGHAALTAPEKS